MVDDDELSAPPPPPRSGRPADILRSPPPAPAQASSAGRWEIPSFERDSTDLAAGLDESWNGDVFNDVRSVSPPAPTQSPPLPPPPASASLPIDTPRRASLDSSALTEISQRIGAQVLASAQALATLAKNRVIGDGTSAGYVQSVLEGVPSVAPVRPDSGEFGHVIFSQTASTVQLRKSDIAPGDVVHVQQAHFSGRRLLKNYKEDIEEAYGVVVEFERKGGKIRVLKANQSANAYPAVESHNWKLEDLKSGTIRVLRIGEAES
ncbi:hypothetical protein BKA62DRAFT_625006 [Auriculariales sp. MPI-PUGE-AT-0066]|nr:hypothetical protein BKA62DRAFT_625006 [Auriculariales sp. MPI-PUGE-AT-0066]